MIYRFGDFELDTRVCELRRKGKPRPLEPQVYDVLAYLVENRDRMVPKQELLDKVWPDRFVTEAALSSRLMAARKAVGDSGRAQRVIKTVHGRGFRFVAQVEERDAAQSAPETGPAPPSPVESAEPKRSSGESGAAEKAGGPREPASSAPAYGRSGELGLLDQWLSHALQGKRQLVFVAGEAGLGKTTLVQAFADQARGRDGLWMAHGQCLEHRGQGEAYMPVLEALGRLCKEPGGAELTALLSRQAPTWLVQMPWLVSASDLEELQRRVTGSTRDRMLREMVEALEAATAERPLLLVLEDLHWSDDSTLDLLSYLARRHEPARLMVIGTYRPAEAQRRDQALHGLTRELCACGLSRDLRLGFLDEAAVSEYLEARFPNGPLPEGLVRLVHQRTGGNPLFMGSLVEHWLSQGLLMLEGGRLRTGAPLEELASGVPESLRQMIEQQIERLDPADAQMLEAASVSGREFSAATAAAAAGLPLEEVENRCIELSRRGQFVRMLGTAEWPDGAFAARFGFTHDLFQEVLYERVPASRRVRLHRQIGERLERGHGAQAAQIAAELAVHFVRGRDAEKAVEYLQTAAGQALRKSAHREAIRHIRCALEWIGRLPEGERRDRCELGLLASLGGAAIATEGWSSATAEEAWSRARRLAARLNNPPELYAVLCGLAAMHEYRGEYQQAEAVLKPRLESGEEHLLVESEEIMACSYFHQGAFSQALEHAERALDRFDPASEAEFGATFGDNPGVSCLDWAGMALWFLGRPDKALERVEEALELAKGHVYSLAQAWAQSAMVHLWRGEATRTLEQSEASIQLAEKHGFPYRVAIGRILRGWALAALGRSTDGVAEIREGLAAHQATGARMDRPYYLALLAEACLAAERSEEALFALAEALSMVQETRTFFFEAELHRLWGATLLAAGARNAGDGALDSYTRAIEVARRQGARSLELRAAMSLARLWRLHGKEEDARELLARGYSEFTEGFDTADLRRARELLGELAGEPPLRSRTDGGPLASHSASSLP